MMDTWISTRNALGLLENSLLCSVCRQLLNEPCTLGNCAHLICKACAEQYAGNNCPVCQAPAWAKDLQVKRELGMVVRLHRRLCRLVNSGPEPTGVDGRSKASDSHDHRWTEESAPKGTLRRDLIDGLETEPMSISESGCPPINQNALRYVARRQKTVFGLETESISVSESGDGTGHSKERRCVLVEVNVAGKRATYVGNKSPQKIHTRNTSEVSGVPVETHLGGGQRFGDDIRKVSLIKETSSTDRLKQHFLEQNDPMMTVYNFEASPTCPKTRKVKNQAIQQVKREVRLKKLAAANKHWGAVASQCTPRNGPGRHVSFSEDNLTESSSAEDIDLIRRESTEASVEGLCNTTLSTQDIGVVVEGKTHRVMESKSSEFEVDMQVSSKANGIKRITTANNLKASIAKGKGKGKTFNKTEECTTKRKSARAVSVVGGSYSSSEIEGKKGKARVQIGPTSGTKRPNTKRGPATSIKRSKLQTQNRAEDTTVAEEAPLTPNCCLRSDRRARSSPNSSFASSRSTIMKRNKRGETSLHLACIKGEVADVKTLLEQGADPNSKDNAGWTPLHEACNHGHTTLLALLLDHGALINAPGFEHDSPLHDSVNNNRLDVVRCLRQRGASLEVRNIQGLTPLDLPSTPQMKEALLTEASTAEAATAQRAPPSSPSHHLQGRSVVLLATGLLSKEKSTLQKCARLLGGKVVEEFSAEVTHLVAMCEDDSRCVRTMKYMQAVLTGRWTVSFNWVKRCIDRKERVDEREYEIPGTSAEPDSHAAKRSRENIQAQFPGLFDGCHFYFSGSFNHPTPSKMELTQLVKMGGGAVINRQPKPDDDVIQVSTIVPYHTRPGTELAACAYFIVYDHLGKRAPATIRSPKVYTVPVWWILDCVSQFTILDPPRE